MQVHEAASTSRRGGGRFSTKTIYDGDCVNEVTHAPEHLQKYWDDISGKELSGKLVCEAREEELRVVDEMKVWELMQIPERIARIGKKPTKVRWVDVNQGDKLKRVLMK